MLRDAYGLCTQAKRSESKTIWTTLRGREAQQGDRLQRSRAAGGPGYGKAGASQTDVHLAQSNLAA